MTDREELEFAAKAAGIHGNFGSLFGNEGIVVTKAPESRVWTGKVWDPLTDDGDALRLAVKLRMSLDTALGQSLAIPLGGKDCVEQHADDPHAATRRAIVRAAAEIGK